MSTLLKEQLLMSNKDFKEKAVENLIVSTEMEYRRTIEDLVIEAKQLRNQRESLVLDVIPTNMLTKAVVTEKFDAKNMHTQELNLEMERIKRIKHILLNLKMYEEHFGPYSSIEEINSLLGEGVDCHTIMDSILFG